MAVKYMPVPMEDPDKDVTLDFSSAFTYDYYNTSRKYKPAFSYNNELMSSTTDSDPSRKISYLGWICHWVLIILSFLLVVLTMPVSLWFSFKMVPQYERLLIFRLGWMLDSKGPGLVFVLPCIDRCHRIDMRMRAFNVPPQQVITVDNAIIEMGADIYFRIADVTRSVTCVQDLNNSTRILVRMSLLKQLVQRKLVENECQKAVIARTIKDDCNHTACSWGVEISRVELSHMKIIKSPAAAPAPHVLFPPSMGNSSGLGQSFPPALQQLASAFLASVTGQAAAAPKMKSGDAVSDKSRYQLLSSKELVWSLKPVLSRELVQHVQATYEFNLEGDEDGPAVYFLDLKHDNGSIGEGSLMPGSAVDTTIHMSVIDLQELFSGNLKPLQAYMSGRLRVSGDLDAALKLELILERLHQTAQ